MFIEFLGKVHFFLTGSDPINLPSFKMLELGRIDHSESDRNRQFELNRKKFTGSIFNWGQTPI